VSQDLQKIFDGVINSLRYLVLPQISEEVDRGQLVAVLTVLSELKLRTEWSGNLLLQQLDAQAIAFSDIERLLVRTSIDWCRPPFNSVDRTLSSTELEVLRDEGDRYLCVLQDQLAKNMAVLGVPVRSVREIILRYVKLQCEHEARMTPAISLGSAKAEERK
jgi:hypothetical protein